MTHGGSRRLGGVRCEEGVPLPTEGGSGPRKLFLLKMACLVHSERYFCVRVLVRKMLNFPSGGDLVDIEVVLFGNSEYSVGIMWLISFLLHYCIVM